MNCQLSKPLEFETFRKQAGLNFSLTPRTWNEDPIPKGLCPPAQGCEVGPSASDRATLGHPGKTVINPNGVAASVTAGGTQPRWGKMMFGRYSQGSSCLATLGFEPESRWDSPSAQVRTRQRGGFGKAHQLFGDRLAPLLDELNTVLAA